MQITKADVIKNGEQDLIDAITADLDWGAIENIFREQHNLGLEEDVEYKQGDIVVHNNQIAYQLQFEVKVTVSVLLDREGNYLSVGFSGNSESEPAEDEDLSPRDDVSSEPQADLAERNDRAEPRELQDEELSPETESPDNPESGENDSENGLTDTAASEVQAGLEAGPEGSPEEIVETPQPDREQTGEKINFNEADEDSDEKISRIAFRAGEIMEELGEEIGA